MGKLHHRGGDWVSCGGGGLRVAGHRDLQEARGDSEPRLEDLWKRVIDRQGKSRGMGEGWGG